MSSYWVLNNQIRAPISWSIEVRYWRRLVLSMSMALKYRTIMATWLPLSFSSASLALKK